MKTIGLDDLVYGHKQAKKVLKVLLKRSQDRYYKKCVLNEDVDDLPSTLKVLLVGPSGTGKTHLIQSLRKIHNFPLISLDATQLMPTGNSEGINIKQLKKLIDDTTQQVAKQPQYHSPEGVLNQMVIFVDEFDKLGTNFDSSGNWNKHVQANFLTMIDNKEEFSGISWVFAGAFSGIYENKSSVKKAIGFFPEAENLNTKEILDTDIIKAGIIPELLGRISLIVELDTFSEADYMKVLIERLLPNYSLRNAPLVDIAAKAHKSGQGIRSMTRQLEMLSINVEFEDIDEDISAIARYF